MALASSYVAEICRFYVLIALVLASLGKGLAAKEFRTSLTEDFHVPPGLAPYAAVAVIGGESVTALLLAWGDGPAELGALCALLMFVLFTSVIAHAMIQHRNVSCHCFGRQSHPVSKYDLLRNGILIAACGYYLVAPPYGLTLDVASVFLLISMAFIIFLVSTNLQSFALVAH